MVDDYSRYIWTFLLQTKSEAITILKQFFSFVETHFNKVIMTLRIDNAKELALLISFGKKELHISFLGLKLLNRIL